MLPFLSGEGKWGKTSNQQELASLRVQGSKTHKRRLHKKKILLTWNPIWQLRHPMWSCKDPGWAMFDFPAVAFEVRRAVLSKFTVPSEEQWGEAPLGYRSAVVNTLSPFTVGCCWVKRWWCVKMTQVELFDGHVWFGRHAWLGFQRGVDRKAGSNRSVLLYRATEMAQGLWWSSGWTCRTLCDRQILESWCECKTFGQRCDLTFKRSCEILKNTAEAR